MMEAQAGIEQYDPSDQLGTPLPSPSDPGLHSDEEDIDHPFRSLFCSHCGHMHRFKISCGSRVCAACRRKWYGYHLNGLLPLVQTWGNKMSMTLTLKNIPDAEFARHHVKLIRSYFARLRKRFEKEIWGGFYVVQATNTGKGWHLHLHVLFEGKFIKQEVLSGAWKYITNGSWDVDIKVVKKPEKALSYLLADFSGRPRIRPGDEWTYDMVFKGSRLVQPFGIYRHHKIKVPFKCPDCGCTDWLTLRGIDLLPLAWDDP